MTRCETHRIPRTLCFGQPCVLTSILHERLRILSKFKHVMDTGEAKQPYHHYTTHPSTHSDVVYDPENKPKNLTNLLNPPLPVP